MNEPRVRELAAFRVAALEELVAQEEARPGWNDRVFSSIDFKAMTPDVIDELMRGVLEFSRDPEVRFPRPRSVPVRPLVKAGGWFASRFNFNRRR